VFEPLDFKKAPAEFRGTGRKGGKVIAVFKRQMRRNFGTDDKGAGQMLQGFAGGE